MPECRVDKSLHQLGAMAVAFLEVLRHRRQRHAQHLRREVAAFDAGAEAVQPDDAVKVPFPRLVVPAGCRAPPGAAPRLRTPPRRAGPNPTR